MTINSVPERSDLIVGGRKDVIGTPKPAWLEFFRSVFFANFGWRRTFTATKSIDFGNIGAQSELTATVAVIGARANDAVLVSAKTQVNGLGVYGVVTANDTVTVVRFNYSAAGIDPAADDFRVIVFQQ